MTFKEILRNDVKTVFLNPEEFGEKHMLNGKAMTIIIDNNELLEREKRIQSYVEGVYNKQMLIYVKARDFGSLPPVGRTLILDQKKYLITDSINEDGIYSISLEAYRS